MLRRDPQLGLVDTSADSEEVAYAIYRDMPAWRKLQLVDDAMRTSRQLALMGLRSRHPGESEARLQRRLFGLLLGEPLATQAYGPVDATP